MQKQQKNKNLKNQILEGKTIQQEKEHDALKLEISRQRQEIHSNKEILYKQVKDIREQQQQELEKQQWQIEEENRQSKKKNFPEKEQRFNDQPLPATNDISDTPAESVMATAESAETDNQPSNKIRQDNIFEVDVTEKRLCVKNVKNDAPVITYQTDCL